MIQLFALQYHPTLDLNAIPIDISNLEKIKQLQKLETIEWLLNTIRPLNNGRYHPSHKGAQANCTLIAEKCVRVLAGLEQPSLVPVKREDLDITFRVDNHGTIVYHEVIREEQVQLVSPQQFIETIDLLEGIAKTEVDLTQTLERKSLKYIASTLSTIAQDIQSLPGSAISEGKDKILCGLIYYYYKDNDSLGHLANFYRDKYGNLFFVDAQSESITVTPPTKILEYELTDEVFFYPFIPKGSFIKKESEVIKEEPDTMVTDTPMILQPKDEEMQEQTDIPDGELSKDSSIAPTNQEEIGESSIEEDTATEDSYNLIVDRNQCNKCTQTFTTLGNLKTHRRIHTGEKPYICDICNRLFNRLSNLRRHKYTHTVEKPFKCNYPGCKKAFIQPGALKRHKRTHTGEKPFKCDYPGCTKAFIQSSDLSKHMRTHTGEKPYQCDQCEKIFTQSTHLKEHKYRIHNTNFLLVSCIH